MNYDFNRSWLSNKFEELRRRILKALQQLSDDQVNWRPDGASHSISTLLRHVDGNIQERIMKGILGHDIHRNRKDEFEPVYMTKPELEKLVQDRFELVIVTVNTIADEQLEQKQQVRNRERTNLDMLHQCAAHYSEHMGQIFYIAKQMLQENYKSTSI